MPKPTGIALLACSALLPACDKSDAGTIYYVVAPVVAGIVMYLVVKRALRGFRQSFESVAAKYYGAVTKFEGGAGAGDFELNGAHDGHRFVFHTATEGSRTSQSLRVMGRPTPAPTRLVLADRAWWKHAAATFGANPSSGVEWGSYVHAGEPSDAVATLLAKPGVQGHLDTLRRSIPLSLQLDAQGVEYRLAVKGQQALAMPKYYKEEILSWFIEAMVALTIELER
ncbi:MAG: hypothetical protein ABI333_01520 [bacterium]